MVGQVAQEAGLAHPGLAVKLDRCSGLERGGRSAYLCLSIQQAGEGAWKQRDRGGAGADLWFLLRHSDVDHTAVYVADLEDVVSDGELAADASFDVHLRVFEWDGGRGWRSRFGD